MKTIILVRHSIPQKLHIENKDIPLSKEGIEKAKELLSFNHVDYLYSSTYLRAYQTAQVLSHKIIKDERLIERLIGDEETADKKQWKMQYDNHDYKNKNGESLNEVKQRMSACIQDILTNMNDHETSIVVSHATSICSYLLNVCDIQVTNEKDKIRKIIFKDKVVLEGRIQKPSCFIIQYDNNEIVDIVYIEK